MNDKFINLYNRYKEVMNSLKDMPDFFKGQIQIVKGDYVDCVSISCTDEPFSYNELDDASELLSKLNDDELMEINFLTHKAVIKDGFHNYDDPESILETMDYVEKHFTTSYATVSFDAAMFFISVGKFSKSKFDEKADQLINALKDYVDFLNNK